MLKRMPIRQPGISMADLLAFSFLLTILVGSLAVAQYWAGPRTPPEPLDLSLSSLPYALFLSLSRITLAYLVCLITSLAVGYWAAHSKMAERIIVPLIDIGQSIPVLGFLPGLVLFFLSLFPYSRTGLEIAAIFTLYTGMAWNLMLSFYSSLKTIPREYVDTIRAYGYGRMGILLRLELPYSMNGIVWNSMLSVAGGWFFLTVCESYTLGDISFQLIGLGSFMSVAAERGDVKALLAGGLSMLLILVLTDLLVWKPLLRWAERFQKASLSQEDDEDDGVLNFFAKSKRITNFFRKIRRRYAVKLYVNHRRGRRVRKQSDWRWAGYLCLLIFIMTALWGASTALKMLVTIPLDEWISLGRGALFTSLRVTFVVILSGLLMVPLGLWLGSRPNLVKRLQPVIQVVAAFPAPMIFPVLILVFVWLSIPLSVGSVLLMMTGAQWYVLFNVISGAAGVPDNLVEVARTSGMSTFEVLRHVYLPAAFPQILTGFLTAAGGAWNTSIVAELVVFRGKEYMAEGLGSYIAKSAYEAQYPQLVAAVSVMVLVIVLVNRLFWARLYQLAESKYRLDS